MNREFLEFFKCPPKEYGTVAFYWWVGEKLTKEKLKSQLEIIKDSAITGLQINYAHDYKGGNQYGLTYKSEPEIFSDEWWELVDWFIEECSKYNISVSMSDYTLSAVGQGFYTDEILEECPEYYGKSLKLCIFDNNDEGREQLNKCQNLIQMHLMDKIYVICYETKYTSIDPMAKGLGDKVCNKFFDRFEEKTRGRGGKELNFFFSDELNFNIEGYLWNDEFENEFFKRKGYSIMPHLLSLFLDKGEESVKVRLDYYDVMVALEEENYFSKIYNWHESRNMIYGCDHGSRGYDPIEFGDYFKTQKYNQAPGCDQPGLASDIVKNKVASSITDLYDRKRVWLEGFYGSGWGTGTDELMDAIARNFALGHNLFGMHGLYYTTLGGWWEWAPPCNAFRMPYWEHMKKLLDAVKRMSFILSQGRHLVDIGVFYPVADAQYGYKDKADIESAFDMMRRICATGIDAGFVDTTSIMDNKPDAKGYKIIILPKMRVARYELLEKLAEYACNGGKVYYHDSLPAMTDMPAGTTEELLNRCRNLFVRINSTSDIVPMLDKVYERRITAEGCEGDVYTHCRQIDDTCLYMMYGMKEGMTCTLTTSTLTGGSNVYLLDADDGGIIKLDYHISEGKVTIRVPQLKQPFMLLLVSDKEISGAIGTRTIGAHTNGTNESEVIKDIKLSGNWNFNITPTCNNKFGDYALPASDEYIGAEVRKLWFATDIQNAPEEVICGYGPYYRIAGPITGEDRLKDETIRILAGDTELLKPYDFSMRYGVYGDPGVQGYHGLKGKVTDDFLCMGRKRETLLGYEYVNLGRKGYIVYTNVYVKEDMDVRVLTGDVKPDRLYIDKNAVEFETIRMTEGFHEVVAVYSKGGRTHLVFAKEITKDIKETQEDAASVRYPLSMSWYNNNNVLPMNAYANDGKRGGCFFFYTAPGIKGLEFASKYKPSVYVEGREVKSALCNDMWQITFDKVYKKSILVIIDFGRKGYELKGAVFESEVKQICDDGLIEEGDWSQIDGLKAYSGKATYRKEIFLSGPAENERFVLDLGKVRTAADVSVNGDYVGSLYCSPYKLDITEFVVNGENIIELDIYNTLSNQYDTVPTRYQGSLTAGLIGPAKIEIYKTKNI